MAIGDQKVNSNLSKANSVDEWDYQDDSYPSLASDPCWLQVSVPKSSSTVHGNQQCSNFISSLIKSHYVMVLCFSMLVENWTVWYTETIKYPTVCPIYLIK